MIDDPNKLYFSSRNYLQKNDKIVHDFYLELLKDNHIPKQNRKQKRRALRTILSNFMWANFNEKKINIPHNKNKYTLKKTKTFTYNDLHPLLKALVNNNYTIKVNGFYDKEYPELSFPTYYKIESRFQELLNSLRKTITYKNNSPYSLVEIKEAKYKYSLREMEFNLRIQNDFMSNFKVEAKGYTLSTTLTRRFKYDQFTGGRFYYINSITPQNCRKNVRKEILIDDIPVVEPDFSSYHTNICYSLVGKKRAIKNVYDIDGIPRELIKCVFTRIYYCRSKVALVKSLEKHDSENYYKYIKILRECKLKGWYELVDIIGRKHQPIEDLFYSNNWGKLQYLDSLVAEKVMCNLRKRDIPSLCIHDSFVVPKEFCDITIDTMESAYFDVTKQRNIKIKL